jgi:hypothetical protein
VAAWLVLASCAPVLDARTLRGVLGDAQERVDLRPAPAFTNFAAHVATLVTAPSLTSASSAALAGTAAIDSSMAVLGPIFLDHAATLGAGVTNVNVIAERPLADATLFGQPFTELGRFAPPVLAERTPTGDPTSPALRGIRLRYHLDLHVWAAAVAVSHGITDTVDLSVVLPVLATRLNCAVGARVVQATGPAGGAFMPVDGPTLGGTIAAVDATGIGDVTVRGKYRLPIPQPWRAALTLEIQFPTGDPAELHGTGAYWITPGIDLSLPLWHGTAEVDAHAALNFNVTHSIQSQALYGVSGSVVLWPQRLAAIVEFLGTSQLDTAFAPNDTNVLVVTPSGGIRADPLLGVGWSSRLDQFNLSFGLRAIIPPGIVVFANGVYALNAAVGLRPVGVVPTVGLGLSL